MEMKPAYSASSLADSCAGFRQKLSSVGLAAAHQASGSGEFRHLQSSLSRGRSAPLRVDLERSTVCWRLRRVRSVCSWGFLNILLKCCSEALMLEEASSAGGGQGSVQATPHPLEKQHIEFCSALHCAEAGQVYTELKLQQNTPWRTRPGSRTRPSSSRAPLQL